ncbi:hypothetical protein [Brevibacillus sp. MCWH]|jgi:hypothetical protein|uniref:hypothetical protein n=1 Tax=Brevibacillus sp. MCWH TaxID=2508871 RepID=UPI001490DCFD|nr:hypothetical protein [Brevibacillus sp. MCWH]NNV03675.1 hypothetical protein [Brevibacillus sp. MCWH]
MESKNCMPTKQEVEFLKKHFHSLDVLDLYPQGEYISLIDRYPRSLTEDEIEHEPLSYPREWKPASKEKQKYLSYEKRFLRFFSSVYHYHNKQQVFVYCWDFADITNIYLEHVEDTHARNIAAKVMSDLIPPPVYREPGGYEAS